MRRIGERELRDDTVGIPRALRDGEEFEVTVDGESIGVLRMTPPPGGPQRFVSAAALRAAYEAAPLTPEQRDAWKQDIRATFDDDVDDPYARAAQRREA